MTSFIYKNQDDKYYRIQTDGTSVFASTELKSNNVSLSNLVSVSYGNEVRSISEHYSSTNYFYGAVDNNGNVYTWADGSGSGYNTYGHLGNNTTGSAPTTPTIINSNFSTAIASDDKVIKIVCGYFNIFYITQNGKLYGSGSDYYNIISNSSTSKTVPTAVDSIPKDSNGVDKKIVEVSCGQYHIIIRCDDGTIYTRGYNTYGQLGDGTSTKKSVFTQISIPGTALQVSAGHSHAAVLTNNNGTKELYTFGKQSNGQLGDNDSFGSKKTPTKVPNLTITNISAIMCGGAHTAFITDDNKVYITGAEENNRLIDYNSEKTTFSLLTTGSGSTSKVLLTHHATILLTNDKKLYVNNTSEFNLQNINELLGSVPEPTISSIPTEITDSKLHIYNKINSETPIPYSLPTNNDFLEYKSGKHTYEYNNLIGLRINKIDYTNNGNTNSYARIYITNSDDTNISLTDVTFNNINNGTTEISYSESERDKLIGGSSEIIWGSESTTATYDEKTRPFVWLKSTTQGISSPYIEYSYNINFDSALNIKIILSTYNTDNMILDIVPIYNSNSIEIISSTINDKSIIQLLRSNPIYGSTNTFKIQSSKLSTLLPSEMTTTFDTIDIPNTIEYSPTNNNIIILTELSPSNGFYTILENGENITIHITSDIQLNIKRDDSKDINNNETYEITNYNDISSYIDNSNTSRTLNTETLFQPSDILQIIIQNKIYTFYFNSISGGKTGVISSLPYLNVLNGGRVEVKSTGYFKIN